MWIKRWKWCDGFSTGITLPISRIEKGKSKRWPVEQNVVVGLKVSERDILTHSGRVSHEEAIEKARAEYEKFRQQMLEETSPVERHFIEAVQEVKQLEKGKARTAHKREKRKK